MLSHKKFKVRVKVRLGREGSGSEWRGPLSPIAGNARDTEVSFQKQNLVRLQTPSSPTPPQSLGPARPQRQAQREKDLTLSKTVVSPHSQWNSLLTYFFPAG